MSSRNEKSNGARHSSSASRGPRSAPKLSWYPEPEPAPRPSRAPGPRAILRLIALAGVAMAFAHILAPASASAAEAASIQPRPISNGGATPLQLPNMKLQTKIAGKIKKKKKTSVDWRMRVAGKQWQNTEERSQYGEMMLDAKMDHVISDSVLMHAWTYVAFRSAYSQTRFGEITGSNAFGAFEAYVQGQPVEAITFQGGLLDQGKWDAPLLLDMVPFPGVLESAKLGKEYSLEARAEQAVPTSKQLNTETQGGEPTPVFMIETLRVAAEPENSPVQAAVYGGLWQFQGLPKQVAADSDGYGNTLITGPDGKPRFKYNFEGWLAGGSLKFLFTKSVSMNVHGQMLQNLDAPETYRNGQQAGGGFEFKLPGGVEILPSYDVFFAESDLSPAAYTQTETGHNNRVGWWGSLAGIFRQQGFKTAITVFDIDVINASASQSRQQFFILKFETLYGSL